MEKTFIVFDLLLQKKGWVVAFVDYNTPEEYVQVTAKCRLD